MPREAARGRTGIGRRLLLAGVVALLVLGLLGLAELGLRVTGVGTADRLAPSRLAYQRLVLPAFRPQVLPDGRQGVATADPRVPARWLADERPADALRVVVLGGSAAAGLGFSPNVTFARHAERLLRRTFPERAVEVVNLGIVALASRQVLRLLLDVLADAAPDVVVVDSGNNEFLELHAERYWRAGASWGARLERDLGELHLVRALRGATRSSMPSGPVTAADLSARGERVPESELVRRASLTAAERIEVLDHYEQNLRAMVTATTRAGVPCVLMTVPANLQWGGVDEPTLDGPADAAALERLSQPAANAGPLERWERAFLRARLLQDLGRRGEAVAAYAEALDLDPRLRRATPAHNARVRRVASETDALLLDAVAVLAAGDADGLVGFDDLYDYVHFTPRGARRLGVALAELLQAHGLVPATPALDGEDYLARQAAALARRHVDSVRRDDWLGVGDDLSRLTDRDLWKYERFLEQLDERLARDPDDLRARIDRGNARSFRWETRAGAEQDWRAALELGGDTEALRANLESLLER